MKFLPDVDARDVHPRLWQFLTWIEQRHLAHVETEITVTSLRRKFVAGNATKHATSTIAIGPDPLDVDEHALFVTAADIRRWALNDFGKKTGKPEAALFCMDLQAAQGAQLGVVLEPEWLSAAELARRYPGIPEIVARAKVAPHIHVQLKRPIRWTALV